MSFVINAKTAAVSAVLVVLVSLALPSESKLLPLSAESQEKLNKATSMLESYEGLDEFRTATYLDSITLDSSFYKAQTQRRKLIAESQYDTKFLVNGTEGENGVSVSDLPKAKAIADKYRGAVMIFSIRSESWFGVGTAFRISEDLILTNAHNLGTVDKNVAKGLDFELTDIDGNVVKADFLGADNSADVALLRLEKPNYDLPFFAMSRWSSSFISDQTLVSIGNPSLLGFWTTSVGKTVQEYYREINGVTTQGADASIPISTGSSGSPIFGLSGELKGIVRSAPELLTKEPVSKGFEPASYLQIRSVASYTKVSSLKDRIASWLR